MRQSVRGRWEEQRGANALTATAGELSTTFTATGVSVGATKLALVQPAPATITVGVPFPAPVLVQLLDGANNPVAQAGVVITATGLVQPANTSFQLTATSNAAGLATFTVLPYVGSTGTLVFTLTGIGITPLTVSPITILAGAATKLVVVTQPPATAVNGVALAPQPGVQITDDGLNPLNVSGVPIAASIATGGGSLGGTRSATTNGSGQATFANLSITGTPGSRTLQFSSGELVQATSTAINVGAGSAVSIQKNTGDLQSATAGTPVAVAPSVTLSDVGGNPVAGVAVVFAVASGGGSATTLNATTNALGIATVGSWTLGGTAGANTLTASSGALSVTFSATGTAGSASKFALVQPLPANISVGGAIAPISVRLIDATNNPVPQAGVLVTATDVSLPGNTTVAVSATTDAAGIATFTLPPYVGAIGSATLTFSAPGISSLTPASLPIVTGPAAKLLLTTQPGASATAGAPLSPQPVVQTTDVGDNPVSSAGVSIVASIFSGGGTVGGTTTINTIASGQAAFTNLAITGAFGPRVLEFSAATLTSVRSNVVTVGAGAAANIAINAGAGQTATVDAQVAVVPSVKVTDASGNPVAGVAVAFTPRSGGQIGGLRSVVTVSTDASGIATVSSWGLGTRAGPNSDSLDVSSAGLAGSPILFVASATAGPATRWIMSTQPPALSPNGATLTPAPAVRLTDGFLNPVSLGGQTATATIGSGVGTLGGVTTATTDAAGVATFGNLTITGTSGIRTLQFSDGVRTAVTSNPVNVTAGGASALLITTQPAASVPAGSPLSPQPIVQLVDAGSNAVSLAGVAVTASIASGGGTLGGTTTVVTAASGSASFTDLSIGGIVGSRTLLFTSGALAGATSGSIAVNAGATRNLGVNSGNLQSAAVGTAVALPPSVKITDPFNNPVGGVAVTFAVSTPGATVSNGISTGTSVIVTTNAAGIAALTSWTLGTTAGSYSMDATAAVATGSPQTFTATAISGLATQLAFITAPSSAATNAIAFSAQPVIQLRDAQNNPVSASGVVITMGITSGVGFLSNFTAITNASGIATFSGLSITGLAGAFNIEFVTGAITLPFGPIALSAGVATQLMIGANPSSSAQVGVPFVTQPVIRLGDVSGNLVSQSGVNVTAVIASGSGALTGVASVSTNASGVAGFTNLAISGSIGSFLLRFTNGPLSSVLSAAINVTAGPGVQLAVAAPPSVTATSGTALTQQPVIQIQDSGGNSAVTAGVLVTATITSGSGSLLNSTATTIAGGSASFSGLTITGVSGPFVLQFGASGYAPVNSGLITVSGPSTLTTKVGTRVSSTVAGTTNPTIAPVFAAKSGAGAPLPGVNVSMTANGRCFLDVAGLLLTTQTKVTDVNGEVTPLVRLPAGADGAGCVIRATGPFTTQTDSALLAVYPSNATHIWVGGTSTSWSTAANWIGPSNAVVAAAPSSADQVFVPNYVGVVNAPRLATAVSVRRLALDTAAIVDANVTVLTIGNLGVTGFGIVVNGTTNLITTASLNGVFDKLVIGQPASCGAASPMLATLAVVQATSLDIYCRAVVDTGLVSATDATVLPGGWLRIDSRGTVLVTNNATFGGDSLTVDGTLQVSGTAQLGGSRVGIYSSNNVTFNNATFSSTDGSFSNSTILVQGNAVFGGAGAGQQTFSGGTLAVFKNFTQLTGTVSGNTGLTFNTSSDHVTAFAGNTSQAVSFADPTTSKFSIVRITNAVTPVVFNSNVQFVNGTTQPRLEVQAGGLTVPNVLNLGGGTWKLFNGTTTTVTGSMVSAGACQGRAAGATLTGTGLINAVPVTSFSCP